MEARRKLGRVNFRKDFWVVTRDREKSWPITERRVSSNVPRQNRETHFGFSSPLPIKTLKKNQFKSELKGQLFEILENEEDYI